MMRSGLLIAVGFVVGCATVLLWPDNTPSPTPNAPSSIDPPTVSRIQPPTLNQTPVRLPRHAPQNLAELASITSEFEQSMYLYSLLRDRDADELVSLLDQAQVLSGSDYAGATAIMFGRLAELDPELALSEAFARSSTVQNQWIASIFHSWARLDLDAAVARATTLPQWFKQVAAPAIARSRSDLGYDALQEIASTLNVQVPVTAAENDISAAWEKAKAVTNMPRRMQNLMAVATQWAVIDPEQALLAVQDLGATPIRAQLEQQIVSHWSNNDPQAAVDWILAQESSPRLGNLIQAIVTRVSQFDLEQAHAIAHSLTGSMYDRAILGLVGQWAQEDLGAATDWLSNLENLQQRRQAVQTIAMTLAQNGEIDLADSWLQSLPEQDAVMANTLINSMLANSDPKLAAQRVQSMEPGQMQDRALRSLVQQWAQNDPSQAARWLEEHPSTDETYQSLTRSWSRWSPSDALDYARSIRHDERRDWALLGAMQNQSADDIEFIVDEITSPEIKQQAIRQAVGQLSVIDPDRAETLRDAAGLDIAIPGRAQNAIQPR